jgi:2-keto-3-deoxy-L-rhamnonate aldolase RhmA
MNNPFKTLLARTDLPSGYPVGTFAMGASPLVVEALGCAGFDWAVVDMEHAPLDLDGVLRMLQAVAGTAMLPITRVPWNDAVMVKRVLDAGAQTGCSHSCRTPTRRTGPWRRANTRLRVCAAWPR